MKKNARTWCLRKNLASALFRLCCDHRALCNAPYRAPSTITFASERLSINHAPYRVYMGNLLVDEPTILDYVEGGVDRGEEET
jgi:hypothetical protein